MNGVRDLVVDNKQERLQKENAILRGENQVLKSTIKNIHDAKRQKQVIANAREQATEKKEDYYKRQVFTKLFQDKCKSLLSSDSGCSLRDFGLLMILSMHIQRRTGTVIKDNGQPMNIKDICNVTGESRTTIYRSLKNLVNAEVVFKVKEGKNTVLMMNPAFVANAGYKFLAEASCK